METNYRCPNCGEVLTTIARGRDLRVYKCRKCEEETAYYLQETTRSRGARPIKIGKLIELATEKQ